MTTCEVLMVMGGGIAGGLLTLLFCKVAGWAWQRINTAIDDLFV